MDLLPEVRLDLAELAGLLLLVLDEDGLVGVLKSGCSPAPNVKLSSLIGETEDLLLAVVGFLEDCVFEVERFALLLEEAELFFFIDVGVVLAFDDLGLGVPLIGFEADLLAGVAVCLAILLV